MCIYHKGISFKTSGWAKTKVVMRIGNARNAVTRLQISMTSSSALSEVPRFCFQVRREEAESTENAANKSLRRTLILRYSRPKWGAIVFCRDTSENQYSMSPLNFKLSSGCFQHSVSLFSSFLLRCQQRLMSASILNTNDALRSWLRSSARTPMISA